MTYTEQIEKQKNLMWHEQNCPAHSDNMGREVNCNCLFSAASTIIDRAASLGLLEGKRQQHEKDKQAVLDVDTDEIDCSCLDYCDCITNKFLKALTSLTPRESGE